MKNQKRKRNNYGKIRNVRDLKMQKKHLEKRIKVRKRLLDKHFNDFNDDLSADYLYRQSLQSLKIQNPFWNIIPKAVKGNFGKGKSFNKKGFLIPLLSGLGAAVTSFFIFKNKNRKKAVTIDKESSDETEET